MNNQTIYSVHCKQLYMVCDLVNDRQMTDFLINW